MHNLPTITKHSLRLELLTILLLTITADRFFYPEFDHGSIVGVFCIAVIGGIALHNREIVRQRYGQIITLLTTLQSILLIWDFSWLSMLLTGAGIVTLALMRRLGKPDDALIWAQNCTRFVLQIFGPLLHMLRQRKKVKPRLTRNNPVAHPVRAQVKTWLFPVTGSIVFLYLFSTINPLIDQFLHEFRFWRLMEQFNIFHILCLFIWFNVLLAVIRPGRLYKSKSGKQNFCRTKNTSSLITAGSMMRGLVMFNAIFALQTGQDYLNLITRSALEDIVTNAQRAAYTLIVTALLAAAIILRARKSGYHQQRPIAAMIYLWIGQNVLLLISAILRLQTYIHRYDLTYLRFSALIWMGIVAMGFIWIVYANYRHKSSRWLININGLTVLTILYTLSFVDVGAMIASYNLKKASENVNAEAGLDTWYITRNIGIDALPALRRHEARFSCNTRPELMHVQETLLAQLESDQTELRRWSIKGFFMMRGIMHYGAPPNCAGMMDQYHG